MPRTLKVLPESWPIAGRFTIARGSRTEARVIVAEIADGVHTGRGECVPYARYGETLEGVEDAIRDLEIDINNGLQRADLQRIMKPGAARNAVDCALWDLEAKIAGRPAWDLAGLNRPAPVTTAFTISLGTPDEMAEATRTAAHRPLLKIKLGADGDVDRLAAVRAAAPEARLIVDANEGWTAQTIGANLRACAEAGVSLVEQPLPASADGLLREIDRPVPVCADESVHDRTGLGALKDRYDMVNIKLDKTGGLTEALAMTDEARRLGFGIMIGCMVGTSLAMAPALLLASRAEAVDLDGPLLLANDRPGGLTYEDSTVFPPAPDLWG